MSFVFEKVPEKDHDFFKSMGLKNCWGNKLLDVSSDTMWCVDRERHAYLVEIGGGYHDMPYFYDFWLNGHILRLEAARGGSGNSDIGVNIIWFVSRIPVPESIWESRKDLVIMIKEAFSVNQAWYDYKSIKSISVSIKCEPTMEEDNYY